MAAAAAVTEKGACDLLCLHSIGNIFEIEIRLSHLGREISCGHGRIGEMPVDQLGQHERDVRSGRAECLKIVSALLLLNAIGVIDPNSTVPRLMARVCGVSVLVTAPTGAMSEAEVARIIRPAASIQKVVIPTPSLPISRKRL